jgi:hypothetical protein
VSIQKLKESHVVSNAKIVVAIWETFASRSERGDVANDGGF